MERIHFIVHPDADKGAVQGVGFRETAVKKAKDQGLTGWIRNNKSGNATARTVEGEVQGEPASVAAFLEWCNTGPSRAKVLKVDRSPIPLVEGETGFKSDDAATMKREQAARAVALKSRSGASEEGAVAVSGAGEEKKRER